MKGSINTLIIPPWILGYQADGMEFGLISTEFQKMEMLPRRELFNNSEGYVYEKPENISDGIAPGNIRDEFNNPESILNMVKEIIKGSYPDVHSIFFIKTSSWYLNNIFMIMT